MRKATGLLMRSELAMAVSEVYRQFIEVRSPTTRSRLSSQSLSMNRRDVKTLKPPRKPRNGVWEEVVLPSMISSSYAFSKRPREAGRRMSVSKPKNNALHASPVFHLKTLNAL